MWNRETSPWNTSSAQNTALSVGYVYSHGLALLGIPTESRGKRTGNFGLDLNLVPPEQQPAFGGSLRHGHSRAAGTGKLMSPQTSVQSTVL